MLSIVSVDPSRWILKLSRSFPICFKSFSNISFRSKRAVTSLKWSYNQYAECWYNQYVAWYYNHCMRIFCFAFLRLKFSTWASKPRGLSPPIVLLCSDWLPLSWESSESPDIRAMAMARDPICVIEFSTLVMFVGGVMGAGIVVLVPGIDLQNFELPGGNECGLVQ